MKGVNAHEHTGIESPLEKEEDIAHIHEWDFSHIHGKYQEEDDLPWDYETTVRG